MTSNKSFSHIGSQVEIPPPSVGGHFFHPFEPGTRKSTYERTGVISLLSHLLRQEGDVYSQGGAAILTPSGVKCVVASVNMELLTEFPALRSPNYKHGTPDGVHPLRQEGNVYSHAGAAILTPTGVKCVVASVNMELLEFAALRSPNYKHGTPDGVQLLTICKLHSKKVSRKEPIPKTHDTPTLKRFPESN